MISTRTGCILLSVGQDEFHDEVFHTLHFVVNQSDFTIQILRNVTDYLSLAKAIYVDQFSLPSNVQNKIDNLNTDLNDAAETLSDKTTENSIKIKRVFNHVYAIRAFNFCFMSPFTAFYVLKGISFISLLGGLL